MTTVSAIITTYNRARLLPRAVDSVRHQTRPADEIIIVDDGSGDTTGDYLTGLPKKIMVLRRTHQGISAARNAAIQQASCEWLAFLDDDDEWLPHKLESQLRLINAHPQYRLCHGEEIWIRNGRRVNPMKKHQKQGGWIYPHCLPLCVISPSTVMIHRDIFTAVGTFDTRLPACEDYDLWLRICSAYPVLYTDESLIIKYGGHDDQLSRQYRAMDRFRIQAMDNILHSGSLSLINRQLTLDMLIKKTRIYINGAQKRGKSAEVLRYQRQLQRYIAGHTGLTAEQARAC